LGIENDRIFEGNKNLILKDGLENVIKTFFFGSMKRKQNKLAPFCHSHSRGHSHSHSHCHSHSHSHVVLVPAASIFLPANPNTYLQNYDPNVTWDISCNAKKLF
jgi:hypothetical protein